MYTSEWLEKCSTWIGPALHLVNVAAAQRSRKGIVVYNYGTEESAGDLARMRDWAQGVGSGCAGARDLQSVGAVAASRRTGWRPS